MDLAEALRRRRTGRRLDPGRPVPLAALAALLHWTARPLHRVGLGDFGTAVLKAVPSAGSCHPIEVYPLVVNVAGIEPGIYRYAPGEHALEALPAAPPAGDELLRWCGDQTFVANAGVLLLYTAVLERTAWKYPTGRSYGSLHLDLGHVSQNAYLVGTALGLGVFFTAATRDALVEEALGVSWTEEVFLGLTGVGVLTDEEARRQRAMADGGPAAFSSPADAWDGLG
nr:SagB family peptide dehydrogenase [Planomonospora venezuelensis]